MTMRSTHLLTEDQITLRVSKWGQGSHQCVLIHGFGDGLHVWPEFADRLAGTCQVLAADLRGHGRSQWDPAERYNVVTYADDVGAAMKAFPAERAVLVGHSMGGEVALRIAAAAGPGIVGLILVDCSLRLDPEASEHIFAEFKRESRDYASVAEYAKFLEASRPMTSRAILQRLADDSMTRQPDGTFRLNRDPALANGSGAKDDSDDTSWDQLRSVRCPTLILRGARSSVLSKSLAERMREQIAGARLQTIARAGHNVMLDDPDAFQAASIPFIVERLTAGR
ncbi:MULTISPECIES: alpha/beta fold hydrolase [unclassified Bradyrhizobium]|uniref:alpha/beta fold hydrolase n=1 Tax=unclassified Bradyrhizobium TaxID=2631580 RepID=UPI001FF4654F|nr:MULTISPECIES: alpha/beta hydrolase [unclassified Bradyrhizobium]MCJ9700071.1 alpha/beta hydrolase [Bradyrhizobium sp. SHOUNA76]MCJ9729079.1 alpha/beta hydrolase [Bradyrhizobium sp. PRIMUS42]